MASHRAGGRGSYGVPARRRVPGATRHRAPGPAPSRYAAVAATVVAGTGVLVLGSAAAADAPSVAAITSTYLSVGGAFPGQAAGADGLPPAHGTVLSPTSPSPAGRASRSVARPPLPAYARPGTGVLTSCFCWRWGAFHDGIDLAAPLGSPIYAAAAGKVVQAGPDRGYGNLIVIQHAQGTVTFYGHEEKILVKVGQTVRAGQRIALVGNLGFSTGPHLHFGVRVNGVGVDPIPWLGRHGIKI